MRVAREFLRWVARRRLAEETAGFFMQDDRLSSEDIAALAVLFDLLARFDADDHAEDVVVTSPAQ
ncbi:hypothetical protein EXS57_03850 [Candidatus Kaiserbacteria bacterium]|nr:hypothetical protein [Candidatus Kaiserbacteria bacterium]